MYDGIVAAIDCHMAAVADNVADAHVGGADSSAHAAVSGGAVRQTLAEVCEHALDKAGAVAAVGQAGAAPFVGVAHKSLGIG